MKYILVTGGSRGIGRAICLKLVSLGMPIVINYNSNTQAAEEAKKLVEDAGGQADEVNPESWTQLKGSNEKGI